MVLYFHDLAMTIRRNGGDPDAEFYNEPRAPTNGETWSHIMPAAYAAADTYFRHRREDARGARGSCVATNLRRKN